MQFSTLGEEAIARFVTSLSQARHRSVDRHPNFCGKPALGLEDQYEADGGVTCLVLPDSRKTAEFREVCTGQPNCIPDRAGNRAILSRREA